MRLFFIFMFMLSFANNAHSTTSMSNAQKFNLIITKEEAGIYNLKDVKKQIILTFFNEKHLTISPEFSENLIINGIGIESQKFLIKINENYDYIGTHKINPYYHIAFLEAALRLENNENKDKWIKYYKKIYNKDIFNNVTLIKKELKNFININVSIPHINYLRNELTTIQEEIKQLASIGAFHHEVGHVMNINVINKTYSTDSLQDEMFSDLYSLNVISNIIKDSHFINKKNTFKMYANWLIELRNNINLNKPKLHTHYTVPALIEGKKYIIDNWKKESPLTKTELIKISTFWSGNPTQYNQISFNKKEHSILLLNIENSENIDDKIMYSQKLFKKSLKTKI